MLTLAAVQVEAIQRIIERTGAVAVRVMPDYDEDHAPYDPVLHAPDTARFRYEPQRVWGVTVSTYTHHGGWHEGFEIRKSGTWAWPGSDQYNDWRKDA